MGARGRRVEGEGARGLEEGGGCGGGVAEVGFEGGVGVEGEG